ncbi:5-(carboxyamino)imidazole ribonucleotide synthase [Sulfuriflexus mobilis]|uniref:5-(carboxyamino)imidazole ribonucleotide synthase n=1 Tax=Sulfuriflexus mobilis TaxID=1811807 RepID=UPI000F8331D2|nr:5-(carboxyamino)imidazole ribonucleotide synthase [Sulfuriflexus mobilis]
MKVGILGGGQLARMLSLAGTPLGVDFVFLCQAHDACAATVGEHLHARFDDKQALEQLAAQVDLVTYEFESVPAESVEYLNRQLPVYPPPQALATARDRLHEKTLFNELGVKTAGFVNLTSLEDLQQAVATIGLPAIIKTRTEGYDGKGQQFIRDASELAAAWEALHGVPAIIEAFVPFDREVSIIAARSVSGKMAFYPLTENEHREGILRKSTALANDPMQKLAESYAERLLEHLDYVGVLAIEFFQVGDALLVNEMAPRVHNSGHWTIEGAETSQFENHIRAILDWPLGSTALLGHSVMLNLIGKLPDNRKVLAQPHAHLHLYGKDERPGRKIGHITVCAKDEAAVSKTIRAIGEV